LIHEEDFDEKDYLDKLKEKDKALAKKG